jgi:hypothetical protein
MTAPATPEPAAAPAASAARAARGRLIGAAATAAVVATSLAVAAWGWPRLRQREAAADALRALSTLARHASVYYVKPKLGEGGMRMPCQFPQGEARSTPAASCCDPAVRLAGTNLCDPSKLNWNQEVWRALGFAPGDPQPFVFSWRAEGTMAQARFVAEAAVDLDCDGALTRFRLVGAGDPAATADNCVLHTVPAFEQAPAEASAGAPPQPSSSPAAPPAPSR